MANKSVDDSAVQVVVSHLIEITMWEGYNASNGLVRAEKTTKLNKITPPRKEAVNMNTMSD